jgi:two-component system, chemotaxis family, response regulator PixG
MAATFTAPPQVAAPWGLSSALTPALVMVLDDNAAFCASVQAMLAPAGMACISATDNINALCLLVDQRPSALLVASESGPLEPWQFVRLLQQDPELCNVRLIYTSACDDVIERARAQAAGITNFLAKPFAADELLALLTQPVQASLAEEKAA